MNKLRVMLAEDHPVYREGLAGLLSASDEFDVVGTCADGEDAIRLASELQPDVVVMDLNLPGIDGVEAARAIASQPGAPGVLMLSMFDDDEMVFHAMRAGARGYLVKTAAPAEVLEAIRSVALGGVVFSGALTTRLGGWFDQISRGHDPFSHLSPREREVLALMSRGLDNAGIASRLAVSPKTVRNLVSNVFAKLHVSDRAGAIAKAKAAGFVGGK